MAAALIAEAPGRPYSARFCNEREHEVADKTEVEIKQLRSQIESLSRRLDTLEKNNRAGPDLSKITSRLDAVEKGLANKKDIKPEHEQAIKAALKQATDAQNQAKEFANKNMVEQRLRQLEAEVKAAMATAAAAASMKR